MKENKLLSAMGQIDEKYIDEASPTRPKSKSKLWVRLGAIAACLCLIVTSFSVWLFAPYHDSPPDVSRYKNSEYYPLIMKLNEMTYRGKKYQNNLEMLSQGFFDVFSPFMGDSNVSGEAPPTAMPEAGGENMSPSDDIASDSYNETTDNQVAGVIEADLFKRTDTHIFYLRGKTVSAYSIAGEDSELVGSFTVDLPEVQYFTSQPEAYLTADCSTFIIVYPYAVNRTQTVELVAVDVTDPANMTQKGRVSVSGAYVSSRLADGKLLLVNNFYVQSADFSNESSFVPQIESDGERDSIPMEDIVIPEEPTTTRYTVLCMLDPESLSVLGSTALLSYTGQIYVSEGSVYATRVYTHRHVSGDLTINRTMTEISRIGYSGDGLEYKGSFVLEGYVKDQYSLDEKDGILRAFMTTQKNSYYEKYSGDGIVSVMPEGGNGTNASLYCVDIESLETVASVENFAPWGEIVQSARFEGDSAYVCTSIQLSDPVFFFDLSDLDNITYTDTGTIDGFSSSLINLGNGFLLGVGVGDKWDTVKIEIYREHKEEVISVCKYEVDDATYSRVYKAYLVDRENSLFGLAVEYFNGSGYEQDYILLQFDGRGLAELVKTPIKGWCDQVRAVMIDGYLYMFSSEEFKVARVFN